MIAAVTLATAVLTATISAPTRTLGFFDPYAPFSSPLQRAEFTEQLATALSEDASPVKGEAYSKATDLSRDLASGRIQFGFVNPQFLWGPGQKIDLRAVLAGTRNGKASCPYALYTPAKSKARNLRQLRGRRLAIVRTGTADEQFVFNAVLQGELRNADFFKGIVFVPDLAGAVGTLRFGRADAFFGPDINYRARFKNRALRRIARAGATLCTVLVVDGRLAPEEQVELTQRVARSTAAIGHLLRRLDLDGLTELPKGALADLKHAIQSDPSRYARSLPMFLPVREPSEKKTLRAIERLEPTLLPEPSLFVVERDGP